MADKKILFVSEGTKDIISISVRWMWLEHLNDFVTTLFQHVWSYISLVYPCFVVWLHANDGKEWHRKQRSKRDLLIMINWIVSRPDQVKPIRLKFATLIFWKLPDHFLTDLRCLSRAPLSLVCFLQLHKSCFPWWRLRNLAIQRMIPRLQWMSRARKVSEPGVDDS